MFSANGNHKILEQLDNCKFGRSIMNIFGEKCVSCGESKNILDESENWNNSFGKYKLVVSVWKHFVASFNEKKK